ncbi:helix-turn-helix domain-containing protein [Paenibacillus sp. YPG26]|uniref:helix-turn-helix domain-containing protein n=1 Tax=Paenibacillus sp. YPG26 TaxID=2878915 RepID=UPI00203E95D3|nr:helix-turn-helix domain-containing protein [Paenibacillus sp. YPG26]USB33794.1 AraC family transcriptional regulator [Paenibacillus sp. YPG26]
MIMKFPVVYALLSIKQHKLPAGRKIRSFRARRAALGLVMEGTGTAQLGGYRYELKPGAVLHIAPETSLELQASAKGSLTLVYIHYLGVMLDAAEPAPPAVAKWGLSPVAEEFFNLDSFHLPDIKELVVQLLQSEEPGASMKSGAEFSRSMLFNQLLYLLSSTRLSYGKTDNAIERTLNWMEQNYMNSFPLRRLPELAGLTPSSYCRAFKRVTGLSPGSYLTQLRIRKAKTLLREPDRTLKDVARHVGYQDELYFSRTFKKSEGMSPTLYRKRHGKRVAIVSHLFLQDHMLALGVKPVAGPSFPSTYAGLGYPSYLTGLLKDTVALNAERRIRYTELTPLSPDVIIKMDFNNNLGGAAWAGYENTVHLNGITSWTGYLEAVAGILGKEDEAEEIVRRMAHVQQTGKDSLRSFTGQGRWAVIRVMQDDIRLYTGNNHALSDLLFGQLGFQPYEMADEQAYLCQGLSRLAEMDPERILVVWSDPAALGKLSTNPVWRELRAVADGQVYVPDSKEWDPWGPLGRELTIQECVRYFGQFQ